MYPDALLIMSLDRRCIVMKAFIESQFNYCPLIWIFHSRTLNNKIKKALRTVYSDCKSSFCELPEKTFSIHHKNIQSYVIEIYKFLNNLSLCTMNNMFKFNQTVPYDLRKRNVPQSSNPSSVKIWYRDHISNSSKNMDTRPRNNQKS